MKFVHVFLLTIALLSGCAYSPQKVNLQPTVNAPTGTEGKGLSVDVRVVDERPSQSLGRRGNAYGAAAEITSAVDLAEVVGEKVKTGLSARGFAIGGDGADAELTVEIRLLDYSTSTGLMTGGIQIQGTLKAIASKSGANYEKIYRSNREERVVVVPTAETNEKWLNDALSDVLSQLVSDQDLIAFLAK